MAGNTVEKSNMRFVSEFTLDEAGVNEGWRIVALKKGHVKFVTVMGALLALMGVLFLLFTEDMFAGVVCLVIGIVFPVITNRNGKKAGNLKFNHLKNSWGAETARYHVEIGKNVKVTNNRNDIVATMEFGDIKYLMVSQTMFVFINQRFVPTFIARDSWIKGSDKKLMEYMDKHVPDVKWMTPNFREKK